MFTTHEVSRISRIPFHQLHKWVQGGYLKPKVRGGKGRGKVNLFSLAQALVLAELGEMQEEFILSGDHVAYALGKVDGMTEVELLRGIGEELSPQQAKVRVAEIEANLKVRTAENEPRRRRVPMEVKPDIVGRLNRLLTQTV